MKLPKLYFQLLWENEKTAGKFDIVFDVHRDESINNAERVKRGYPSGISFNVLAPEHMVKHWKNFLQSVNDKAQLTELFAKYWN